MSYAGRSPAIPRKASLLICQAPVATADGSATPVLIGSVQFDLSTMNPNYVAARKFFFRASFNPSTLLKTAHLDLYDVAGIVGAIGPVAGSEMTTASVTPGELSVDLSAVFNAATGAGIIQARLWLAAAAAGETAVASMARLDVEY